MAGRSRGSTATCCSERSITTGSIRARTWPSARCSATSGCRSSSATSTTRRHTDRNVTTEDNVIQRSPDDVLDPPTEDAITGEREHVRRLAPFLDARPRSIVRPGAFVLLDGEWHFERDPENRGLAERWYVGHGFAATANWPGSVAAQIETDTGHDDRDGTGNGDVIAWYEREFEIPDDWRRTRNPI